MLYPVTYYQELVERYDEELVDMILLAFEESAGIEVSSPPLDKGLRLQHVLQVIHEKAAEDSTEDDLSEAELKTLKALHEKLAALRASNSIPKNKKRRSLRALIAYAACNHGVNEEIIRALVERHFEFDDISELYNGHYDELVRFLDNVNVKEILN